MQSNSREKRAESNAREVSRAHAALDARRVRACVERRGRVCRCVVIGDCPICAPERAPLVVPSLVGTRLARARVAASQGGRAVQLAALPGPAYTLSPEPMTDRPILDTRRRPRSVWSALLTLDPRSYRALVLVAYGYQGKDALQVLADSLLFDAVETARFEVGPAGGWLVWIDRAGKAKVEVHP